MGRSVVVAVYQWQSGRIIEGWQVASGRQRRRGPPSPCKFNGRLKDRVGRGSEKTGQSCKNKTCLNRRPNGNEGMRWLRSWAGSAMCKLNWAMCKLNCTMCKLNAQMLRTWVGSWEDNGTASLPHLSPALIWPAAASKYVGKLLAGYVVGEEVLRAGLSSQEFLIYSFNAAHCRLNGSSKVLRGGEKGPLLLMTAWKWHWSVSN